MRIALFSDHFLPKIDGVVTRLAHTVRALVASGDEVMVFAPRGGPTSIHGAPVVGLKGVCCPWYPEKCVTLPSIDVVAKLRAFEPDLIHAINPLLLGVQALALGRKLGLPIVASQHSDYPKYLRYYGMGWLEGGLWRLIRLVLNRADRVLCTSTPMYERMRGYGIERLRVWQRGIDTEGFRPDFNSASMRRRLSNGRPERPLILHVGRLAAEKEITRLRAVLDELPEAQIAIVGDGPYRPVLEQKLDSDRVNFMGYMSGNELATAYASADVFVLPSRSETLGLVLLEAMASACPVVAARAGGIPDIVDHGRTGLLFQADCNDDLVSCTAEIIADRERQRTMGRRARHEAERWSWAAATDQLRGFYRELGVEAEPQERIAV